VGRFDSGPAQSPGGPSPGPSPHAAHAGRGEFDRASAGV
ncbi:MAG: hypothetical protein AVDCRST_MAG89-92, partial [uncultured Gemmatimonadetes bacterium]